MVSVSSMQVLRVSFLTSHHGTAKFVTMTGSLDRWVLDLGEDPPPPESVEDEEQSDADAAFRFEFEPLDAEPLRLVRLYRSVFCCTN